MARNRESGSTEILLDTMDRAFDKRSWHGTTLAGSLRGLKPDLALWRPADGRHSIWDYLLHTAYWKYIVRRRLSRDRSSGFPRSPSDWPRPSDPADSSAWKKDVALLKAEHAALRDVVAAFPERLWEQRAPESQWSYREHVMGIAAHDLYHAGQIQLLKRLFRQQMSR